MSNNVNSEIVAVISAAIAAQYSRPGHKLEVKAIRRIAQSAPVWNTTGKFERLTRNINKF